MDMLNLSIEEKIGQMFLVGIPGTEIDDITRVLITKFKIGGVILYRKNIVDENQLINLINELKELNANNPIPLFISVDEEGGRVNRMPKTILNLERGKNIVKAGGKDLCYKSGQALAEQLKLFGMNLNFAPILDIGGFKDGHNIGDRCYGSTAEEVSENAIAAMKGIMDSGIISVVKHFPGHGASKGDSHVFMPVISRSIERLEKEDVMPFKTAIEEGVECIMIGHLILTKFNFIYPASLSYKVITKFLREKLNFKGVVISDDLSMRGISLMFNLKTAVIKSIKAGSDIVMINKKHKSKIKIINHIKKLVLKNKIDLEIINERVSRIIELKRKHNLNNDEVKLGNIDMVNNMVKHINDKVKSI